jgi:hypothetical protein
MIDSLRLRKIGVLMAAATLFSGTLLLPVYPVRAQALLEQEGTLRSAEGEHTFSGEAGQAVKITVTSPDFDTTLSLLDPSGAELAFNDDYARGLNSTIVYTLPTSGTYKVVARSLSGTGGSYEVVVADATAFDQAYFRGVAARQEGDYTAAIAAFDEMHSMLKLSSFAPKSVRRFDKAMNGRSSFMSKQETRKMLNSCVTN